VEALFERLRAGGRDARSLGAARLAAMGPGTARALADRGIVADVVPDRFVAEALVAALAEVPVTCALIARARDARDVLPDALRARGAEVDVLAVYETVAEPLSERALDAAREADYITFTSSSTVRFFLDAVASATGGTGDGSAAGTGRSTAPWSPATRVVSIGPVTSEMLRERGFEPDVEAERHDIDGVLDAVLADAASNASKPAVS
jgi:uroporphyrinogen III methyltransferase/synthase